MEKTSNFFNFSTVVMINGTKLHLHVNLEYIEDGMEVFLKTRKIEILHMTPRTYFDQLFTIRVCSTFRTSRHNSHIVTIETRYSKVSL